MDHPDKAIEQLKNKTVNMSLLMELLECPVCMEMVKLHFRQCQSGHLVCNACAETLPNCPTCRGEYSVDSQICMKNLLEALPRLCRYHGNGCTDIVGSKDDHEVYCGYRPVKCMRCEKEKQAFQLKQHLENDHSNEPFEKNLNSRRRLLAYRNKIQYRYDSPMFAMGTLFWLSIKFCDLFEMDLEFCAVFIGKPVNDYFITVKFEKDGVGSRVTLKAADYRNQSEDEGQDDECSTKIFRRTIQRCIDDEGGLVFDCELSSKPKSAPLK